MSLKTLYNRLESYNGKEGTVGEGGKEDAMGAVQAGSRADSAH